MMTGEGNYDEALERFHEVAVTTSAGAFFVDVAAATDRAFQCGACGEVFDLRADLDRAAADEAQAPPPTTRTGTPIPRPAPARDLLAQLEAESAQRAATAPQRAAAIDAELAALKRKLGK